MKFNTPTLVTITAPSCAGKSVLLNHLIEHCNFERIISTTTRVQRQNETDGVDYFFISEEESFDIEQKNNFVELVKFNNTRYGVVKDEMNSKLHSGKTPCIIIEPNGIDSYKKYCLEHGVQLFKIFVSTTESIRIDRLNARTSQELLFSTSSTDVTKIIASHTTRLLSMTNEERRWQNASSWDAIVPGNDLTKAVEDVKIAIKWKNKKQREIY